MIGTKLRRQESFMMTWLPRDEVPASRLTIWLHPSIPLIFAFDDAVLRPSDPARIDRMMEHVAARGELVLDQLP